MPDVFVTFKYHLSLNLFISLKWQEAHKVNLLKMSNTQSVRMEGVEPTRLAALDPKSSASANFATSAYYILVAVCQPACRQAGFATSAQGRKNRGF